jgi:hypothetical protein
MSGCPAHQFATGINASGGLNCAAPTIDDLQGSAFTFDGHTSSLQVSTDNTTGDINLKCSPVYEVSATISGGSSHIQIFDDTNNSFDQDCFFSTSCSTLMPGGHQARVLIHRSTSFSFTCPGD